METPLKSTATARDLHGLGISSIALGFLGLVFCWLEPLGIVLSLAGLLVGIFGWALASRRGGRAYRLAVGGTALSAVALVTDLLLTGSGVITEAAHRYFSL
jgi:hypothetical protein